MSRLTLKNIFIVAICACFLASFTTLGSTIAIGRHRDDQAEVFTKCWDYSASADLAIPQVADADNIYFVNTEGRLESVDLKSAVKVWSSEVGGVVISNIFATDNAVFLVTRAVDTGKAALRSLSKQTGVANWSTPVDASRVTLGTIDGVIIVVGTNGSVTAFNSSGTQAWEARLGTSIVGDPEFRPQTVTVATTRNEIVDVAVGGQTKVRSKTDYLPSAMLINSAGEYLIGDERGNLLFAESDGDRRWRFKNGARISFLLSYEGEFLVASYDNFLYKLSRGGNVEWKNRLPGRVSGRPVISGDTVIVSIIGDGSVYFIDLENGKVTNRVQIGDENSGSATASAEAGVVLSGPSGLSLYTRGKCPSK